VWSQKSSGIARLAVLREQERRTCGRQRLQRRWTKEWNGATGGNSLGGSKASLNCMCFATIMSQSEKSFDLVKHQHKYLK
jgi:hypothetical protein